MTPPTSEEELLMRARALAGSSLGQIAATLGVSVPVDLKRHKGWVGQLLEQALGASAGSRAVPDFPELGIELKSLPVDRRGVPRESTFVTTVPLSDLAEREWEQSRVHSKLGRVLWIPVLAEKEVAMVSRPVGAPLLWSPDEQEQDWLREDWEELGRFIEREGPDSLTAHVGKYLQVRPKAADGQVRRLLHDPDGARRLTAPKGFYLRARFTRRLLDRHYVLPG